MRTVYNFQYTDEPFDPIPYGCITALLLAQKEVPTSISNRILYPFPIVRNDKRGREFKITKSKLITSNILRNEATI